MQGEWLTERVLMGVHWVVLPFEEGVLPKQVERGNVACCGGWGTWYE